ncbi:MAG TPA: prepilin peptidase [Candidatus Saccharimonadales bacterium]|nr:prepilin peptidase [Candidatus Saccharimonadales bacterium]
MFWPFPLSEWLQIGVFALWLIAAILLVILFAYDIKWFLLPNRIVFPLVSVSLLIALAQVGMSPDWTLSLISVFGAVLILSGLYLLLWLVSKGEWIGFGDVKLGLALALLLADWKLAFLCLFMANLIGLIVVVPGMTMGKITRKTRVPFGPLLIVSAVITLLFGTRIIEWYLSSVGHFVF